MKGGAKAAPRLSDRERDAVEQLRLIATLRAAMHANVLALATARDEVRRLEGIRDELNIQIGNAEKRVLCGPPSPP